MTERERSQQILLLQAAQRQFECLMDKTDGILNISDGDEVKHVYSGAMAQKMSRALARVLEQERMKMLRRSRNEKYAIYTELCKQ